MKLQFLVIVSLGILAILGLNAFQCGSAESTSAKLYISRGDWAGAERVLLKEVTNNPNNAEAWFELGEARRNLGNTAGMLEAYDKASTVPGAPPDVAENVKHQKLAVWSGAIRSGVGYSQRIAQAPKDSTAILRQLAVDNYKTAILVEPDSVTGYHNLAIAQFQSENFDDAISTLKEGIKRKPAGEMYSLLADAYLQKAQTAEKNKDSVGAKANYEGALTAMTEARKMDPTDEQLLNSSIDLYTRLGRASEAKPIIREGIAKYPGNKVYQYNLGVLLMQTDSLRESLPYFDAAIKSDSSFEAALINAGSVHMKLGDKMRKATQGTDSKKADDKSYVEEFRAATLYYTRLTTMKPEDANYWEYLASAYANAGMTKKAQDAIAKADALKKK